MLPSVESLIVFFLKSETITYFGCSSTSNLPFPWGWGYCTRI